MRNRWAPRPDPAPSPYAYVVSPVGQTVAMSFNEWGLFIGYTQSELAAVDLLVDDNYPMAKAVQVARAATRSGRDAESVARHMLKLRRALRDDRP